MTAARRGLCSVCQRDMAITRTGGIRHHGHSPNQQHRAGRTGPCPGTGRPPAGGQLGQLVAHTRAVETVTTRGGLL